MPSPRESALEKRVERLEKAVEHLQSAVHQLVDRLPPRRGVTQGAGPPPAPADSRTHPRSGLEGRAPPVVRSRTARQAIPAGFFAKLFEREGEFWLNRLGIGLVLFGIAFLFKYSIDRGWITPLVRVLCGLAVSAVLLGLGLRLHRRRPQFSRVLLGGGIGGWYITGFASYQLYDLVSYPLALAFMVAVTIVAFVASMGHDEAVPAVVGAAGGFATPFLLASGSGSVPGLVTYEAIVLAGTGAIFLVKGWRALLLVSLAGGWGAMLMARVVAGAAADSIDRWALQLGALVVWLAFWGVPVLREWLRLSGAPRWQPPGSGLLEAVQWRNVKGVVERHPYVLTVVTPVAVFWYSTTVWPLTAVTWGWVSALAAGLYTAITWTMYRWDASGRLGYAHAAAATVLLTVALGLLLDGGALMLAWAAEAAALHFTARRVADRGAESAAMGLFAVVGTWWVVRLEMLSPPSVPLLNPDGIVNLGVIALAVAAARTLSEPGARRAYWLVSHAGFLAWWLRELSGISNGQGYVSLVWGAYAIALLVAGMLRGEDTVRTTGLVTLLVVVAKLFLVDLASVEALWRIMLFLGIGGLLLVLSYYFRSFWVARTGEHGSSSAE